MSYILQALAQSERDRRHADAPDLAHVFDVETPTEKGKGHRRLIFGGLLLLINAAVIAAFILFGDFQFGDKATTSPAAVTDTAPIPESIPASLPSAPQPGIPIVETPANDIATQRKSFEDQAADYINKTATQEIPIEDAPQEIPIEDTPIAKTPVVKPKPVVDELAKAVKDQHNKIVGVTGLERVNTLPGIDMSVHAYSENIAERFVFINGEEFHEGDKLAGGGKIEAITPDGIVVDFGDQRVLLSRIR